MRSGLGAAASIRAHALIAITNPEHLYGIRHKLRAVLNTPPIVLACGFPATKERAIASKMLACFGALSAPGEGEQAGGESLAPSPQPPPRRRGEGAGRVRGHPFPSNQF